MASRPETKAHTVNQKPDQTAATILGLTILTPAAALILGLAVRAFLWAAGL